MKFYCQLFDLISLYLGCGSFNSEFHGSTVTLAFGGWDGGRTIYDDSEVLIEGENSWIEGKNLFFTNF